MENQVVQKQTDKQTIYKTNSYALCKNNNRKKTKTKKHTLTRNLNLYQQLMKCYSPVKILINFTKYLIECYNNVLGRLLNYEKYVGFQRCLVSGLSAMWTIPLLGRILAGRRRFIFCVYHTFIGICLHLLYYPQHRNSEYINIKRSPAVLHFKCEM